MGVVPTRPRSRPSGLQGHARSWSTFRQECGSPPPGSRVNAVRRQGNSTVAHARLTRRKLFDARVPEMIAKADVVISKLLSASSMKKLFDAGVADIAQDVDADTYKSLV